MSGHTIADVRSSKHDRELVEMILESIETPLRSSVALNAMLKQTLDSDFALEIARAAEENYVVEVVTDSLALITASWHFAGLETDFDGDPRVVAWGSRILTLALSTAKSRYAELIADYDKHVGPIPPKEHTHECKHS